MSKKNVQQELNQLAEMITWFQSDEFTLEEAVGKYKEAEALAGKIEADLGELKNDIQVIKQRFDKA